MDDFLFEEGVYDQLAKAYEECGISPFETVKKKLPTLSRLINGFKNQAQNGKNAPVSSARSTAENGKTQDGLKRKISDLYHLEIRLACNCHAEALRVDNLQTISQIYSSLFGESVENTPCTPTLPSNAKNMKEGAFLLAKEIYLCLNDALSLSIFLTETATFAVNANRL